MRAVRPVQPAEQAALLAPTGFWQARRPTVGYARGTRFASKPELIEGFAQGGLTNSIASCEVVHTNGDSLTSNRESFVLRLVNDRRVKAWNQWEHKRMKELKKLLPKNDQECFTWQIVPSPV